MENLYGYIPEYGATVVFVVFMLLWHKRTMARDAQFHETTRELMRSLMECVSQIKREHE